VKEARDRWFGRLAGVQVNQLVFIDEFGATTTLQRTHGRAPPGERVVSKVPHGHWKVISTIAAMSVKGIEVSASFDDATDTELFVTFVREALTPRLRRGQVVVLDNLSPHKCPEVNRLIEAAGARVLRLPPYSPDFNPIELAISKIKSTLKKLACRQVDGLFTAIGTALNSITSIDARNYIRYRGYATMRSKPL
jgi:transposase